ncbi:MAG: TerB family tellurite resistance protein [Candidatus Omnitrophica bacterium]|nr:TerB family tellurite resistance protein [Candidatus Omnitrophota bacterium]
MGLFGALMSKIQPDTVPDQQSKGCDDPEFFIALGVLMWEVALADDQFLPEERKAMVEVLRQHQEVNDDDMRIVLRAIEEASLNRIDLHTFTHEIIEHFDRKGRIEILEHLFRVACIDHDLAGEEHEMLRKISTLLRLEHEVFIQTKVKVKKEFGMDTVDL